MTVRYTIILDEAANENMERLRATYGLKHKAETYELAVRVLSWLTDQRVSGFEVGRFKDDTFQPLLLPREPRAGEWNKPKENDE